MKTKTITLSTKVIALMFAGVLLLGGIIGGTLAWLVDTTETVTNTFTYGDINISLWETTDGLSYTVSGEGANEIVDGRTDISIIPGVNQAKNPTVTVVAGSEKCYLFVEVTEENWPTFKESEDGALKVAYSVDVTEKWTLYSSDTTNSVYVYYQLVDCSDVTTDTDYEILTDNQITVSSTLTKDEIDSLKATGSEDEDAATAVTQPTLTFKAYAVQYKETDIDTAEEAWAIVGSTSTN